MKQYEEAQSLHPHFGVAHYFMGQCEEAMGRYSSAVHHFQKADELTDASSETWAGLAHCFAENGNRTEANDLLGRLRARAEESYVSPVLLAQVHTGLGETEAALNSLEEAVDVRASDLIWLGVRPTFDPLRQTRRFRAISSKIGLA
jgi:tetratricopeptide (TPR) repeat protein